MKFDLFDALEEEEEEEVDVATGDGDAGEGEGEWMTAGDALSVDFEADIGAGDLKGDTGIVENFCADEGRGRVEFDNGVVGATTDVAVLVGSAGVNMS